MFSRRTCESADSWLLFKLSIGRSMRTLLRYVSTRPKVGSCFNFPLGSFALPNFADDPGSIANLNLLRYKKYRSAILYCNSTVLASFSHAESWNARVGSSNSGSALDPMGTVNPPARARCGPVANAQSNIGARHQHRDIARLLNLKKDPIENK